MNELDEPNWDGTLMERMGIKPVSYSAERAEVEMDIAGNTQPMGILHGGANAVLVETAASLAAAYAAPKGMAAVCSELSVSHLRPATTNKVKAVASALRIGKSQAVYAVKIYDEDDRLTACGRMTGHFIPIDER